MELKKQYLSIALSFFCSSAMWAASQDGTVTTQTTVTPSTGSTPVSASQTITESSATSKTSVQTPASIPSAPTAMNPAYPVVKWTELAGRVININLQTNILQIQEKGTDKLIEIPVTADVKIYKKGRREIALGDLEHGDKVTVRNANPGG